MALQDRDVTGAGYQLVIRSGSVGNLVRAAILKGLDATGKDYIKQVKSVISLDDHTLAELRRLGHPYARKGGGKRVHSDDRDVHIQSGRLRKSIKLSPVEETTSRRFTVYAVSDAPEMRHLIWGTTMMRPRRFHEKAYEQIRSVMWNPLVLLLRGIKHRIHTVER
jgi:hypothetical protein